jgi:universal stress protein A
MNPSRTILVPIDFSEGSATALEMAKREAGPNDDLHLVHVLPYLSAMHPGVVWATIDDQERVKSVQKALHEFAEKEGAEEAALHVPISTGNPAVAVADLAARLGVDLVVVASHGRTGLARLTLGSVAEGIVRLCKCPVLVVKSLQEDS